MRLGDLKNIMCCDVILAYYEECDCQGIEIFRGHSMDIPGEFHNRIVMNVFPVDDSIYLLLRPVDDED